MYDIRSDFPISNTELQHSPPFDNVNYGRAIYLSELLVVTWFFTRMVLLCLWRSRYGVSSLVPLSCLSGLATGLVSPIFSFLFSSVFFDGHHQSKGEKGCTKCLKSLYGGNIGILGSLEEGYKVIGNWGRMKGPSVFSWTLPGGGLPACISSPPAGRMCHSSCAPRWYAQRCRIPASLL